MPPAIAPASPGGPVGGGHRVKEGLAILAQQAVSVLVQPVDAPLLLPPFAIHLDGTDGAQHMEVRIGDTTVLLVRLVDGEVHHHAPAHKLFRYKLPCEGDVFFQGKLVLQGNVKLYASWAFLPHSAFSTAFQRVARS